MHNNKSISPNAQKINKDDNYRVPDSPNKIKKAKLCQYQINCITLIKNIQHFMSSFIETTEQATTQMQDFNKKIMSQLKTYTFFIFYQQSLQHKNQSIIEKMNFSLKDQKCQSLSEGSSVGETSKQVELHFYDLNNPNEMLHAISDVRGHSFENKAKIVMNASEEKLGWVIGQFEKMKVDIAAIPILLNSDQFQSDISAFLGWKNHNKDCMAVQILPFYREVAEQWIKSTNQKMDVWRAEICVSQQKGQILHLANNKLSPLISSQKRLSQYFISHFCIGYHASTMLNCKQKITRNDETIGNSLISFVERLRKFCCIGERGMKSTTGIVNITLVDENGEEIELLKQLRAGDSSEEESQTDLRAGKYKQYRDVVSILVANINMYQGSALQKSIQSKVNDGKLELITFDSQKGHRKICSSAGQIKLKLEAPVIDVQVGESFYRLQHPEEIVISFGKKIRMGIDNQLVKC